MTGQDDAMTADEIAKIRAIAAAAGLQRAAAVDPKAVARAHEFARDLADRLPRDLDPTDEPAHVFRAAAAASPGGDAQ